MQKFAKDSNRALEVKLTKFHEMSLPVTQEAIFIGANKQNYVSDYNLHHKIIAFGAGTTVAIWNPLDETHRGSILYFKEAYKRGYRS